MIISAKNLYTKLYPMLFKKYNYLPKRFYYLITPYKALQSKIDDKVLKEFFNDSTYFNTIKNELQQLTCNFNSYHITCSECLTDLEGFLMSIYDVTWLCDDYIIIKKKG